MSYPIAKGTIINFAALVGDPSLAGPQIEGRWVSDATREELVEYFENFELHVRSLVKVSTSSTKQIGWVQATHGTGLRRAVQVGLARRKATPILHAKQGRTYWRCGASFLG